MKTLANYKILIHYRKVFVILKNLRPPKNFWTNHKIIFWVTIKNCRKQTNFAKNYQQVSFTMAQLDELDDFAILFSGISSDVNDETSSISSSSTSSSKSSCGRKRIYNQDEKAACNKRWCKESRARRKQLVADVVAFCQKELNILSTGICTIENDVNHPTNLAFLAEKVKNLQTVFSEMQFH